MNSNRKRYKRGWRTEVRWQLKWAWLFSHHEGELVVVSQAEVLQAYEKPLRDAVSAREAQYGQVWLEMSETAQRLALGLL